MAYISPLGTDLLSAKDHARLHRIISVDEAAPEGSLLIDASGNVIFPGPVTLADITSAVATAEASAISSAASAVAAAASAALVDPTQIISGDTKVTTNETADKVKVTTGGTLRATIDADGLTLAAGTSVNELSIDGTMAGNSDDAVPTEKAVVTYVGAQISAIPTSYGWEHVKGGAISDVDDSPGIVVTETIAQNYLYHLIISGYTFSVTGNDGGNMNFLMNATSKLLITDCAYTDGSVHRPFVLDMYLSYDGTNTLASFNGYSIVNSGTRVMTKFDSFAELAAQVTSLTFKTHNANSFLGGRYFLYRTKQ